MPRDAAGMGATLSPGGALGRHRPGGRRAYLVTARGEITVNGIPAGERAGVEVSGEDTITMKAVTGAEVVLVDVA